MKGAPKGVVGGMFDKLTGETENYNKAVEELAAKTIAVKEAQLKLARSNSKLSKMKEKLSNITNKESKAYKDLAESIEEVELKHGKLELAEKRANREHNTTTANLDELKDSQGLAAKGAIVFATKIAGATTAVFSFGSALDSIDKRLKLSSKSMLQTSIPANVSYTDSVSALWKETMLWNDTVTETNMDMAKLGFGVDKTASIMGNLSEGLRLSTNNMGDLRENVGQMTQDIGFMSKLLQTNTEDLANATVTASKKFGKGTDEMADDLAGMYDALTQVQQGSKDSIIHIGDLTQAVMESQASFQGYNFNLRAQATLMANISAKAQEQGASYQGAMAAAKGLTDILQGGAPEWAKYVAGNDLMDEIKKTAMRARKEKGNVQDALAETFGIDAKSPAGQAQLKGLENLSENYRKFGRLSSAMMAEELLRGTETGNKKMFELLKKHATKPEGRELLKRVWGLDDAAATAATLALQGKDAFAELSKIKLTAQQASEARKPPTMADMRKQHEAMMRVLGVGEEGVVGTLRNILGALTDNPILNTIMGSVGTATSVLLQLAQMQALGGTGGAVAGKVLSAGGAMAKAPMELAKNFSLVGDSSKGLRGGINSLASRVLPAFGKELGGSTKAMGKAGLTGSLLGALGAGVAFGTALRHTFPIIDEWSQSLLDSAAELLGAKDDEVQAVQRRIQADNQAQRMFNKKLTDAATVMQEGSIEWTRAASNLQGATDAELVAYSKHIADRTNLSEEEAKKRLLNMRNADVTNAKMSSANQAHNEKLQNQYDELFAGISKSDQEQVQLRVGSDDATLKNIELTQAALKEWEALGGERGVVEGFGATAKAADKVAKGLAGSGLHEATGLAEQALRNFAAGMPSVAVPGSSAATFEDTMRSTAGPVMTPLDLTTPDSGGDAGGGGGEGGSVGAAVGPDGSITIKFILPRDAIDASTRQSKGLSG